MNKVLLLSLVLSIAGCTSWLDHTDIEARNKMMESRKIVCRAMKPSDEKDECFSNAYWSAASKYPYRGTEAYSVKHYSALSKAEAEKTLVVLRSGFDHAGNDPTGDQELRAGTIGKFAYIYEAQWIRKHIFGEPPTCCNPW